MPSLRFHQRQRHLVSIRRSEIDDYGVQGYILGVSKQLLAVQYVYDFNLDGLLLLSRSDITEVRRTKTDVFQQSLLLADGIERLVPFDVQFNLSNWRSVLQQLAPVCPVLIFESERAKEPLFEIGRLVEVTSSQVEVHGFSGTARWAKETTSIPFSELTCVQANTNYINTYQRYFTRSAA
jgi:hypothetical protein